MQYIILLYIIQYNFLVGNFGRFVGRPDTGSRAKGKLWVVDKSGADYLFPAALFLTGVRFPGKRLREKSGRLFSRDAVLKRVWKTASRRATRKAPARGR